MAADGVDDNRAEGPVPPGRESLPWHVPELPEESITDDLPAAVAEAARRAFDAREAGARVVGLIADRTLSRRRHQQRVLTFVDGDTTVEISISPRAGSLCLRLHVSPPVNGTDVEVRHGGATVHGSLDSLGEVEFQALRPGLLSVLLQPAGSRASTLQTSWVRVSASG